MTDPTPVSPNAALILSPQGEALIKASESLQLVPYRDVAGYATIGWGHRIAAGETFGTLTRSMAEMLFEKDAGLAAQAVKQLVTVSLTQGQFDALVDFTFNEGAERLKGSTLLKLLNSDNRLRLAGSFFIPMETAILGAGSLRPAKCNRGW